MSCVVVGVDPGFALLGLCAVELFSDGGEQVLGMRLVETKKSDKRLRVLASDDNMRRTREIYRETSLFMEERNPVAFVTESFSPPRNAQTAAKVARAIGVIAALAEAKDLPIVSILPKTIKKVATGKATASKQEIEHSMRTRYSSSTLDRVSVGIPPSKLNHVMDALAAVVASLDSDVIRAVRVTGRVRSALDVPGSHITRAFFGSRGSLS